MIKYLYAVIDPKFDRPFFSSNPPPATLERTLGMQVIRYDIEVPDPAKPHGVVEVVSEERARQHARDVFKALKE